MNKQVMDAQDLNLSMEKGHLSVYCVASMENLSFKTQEISDFSNVVWNEGFYLFVFLSSLFNNEIMMTMIIMMTVMMMKYTLYHGVCINE